MNSGLPSLLDAIFGKKDLASVSLDEMYEIINEFPSFNAGHFLLSKKLKEQNDATFEKESMRTALYFHNAFWLQTLLEEGNNIRTEEISAPFKDENAENLHIESPAFETIAPLESFLIETFAPAEDELDEEIEEILDEKTAEQPMHTSAEFQQDENEADRVISFDDLILKYKIDTVEPVYESPVELTEEPIHESYEDSIVDTIHEAAAESHIEPQIELPAELRVEEVQVPFTDTDPGQFENIEEIVNEYGIFEEVVVRKSDLDLEAFDRPIDTIPTVSEAVTVEIPLAENGTISSEILSSENETIVENQIREESYGRSEERDYEAFDGPDENIEEEEDQVQPVAAGEIFSETSVYPVDAMEKRGQQKSATPFDAKNAESIVFAPYHMIDYFASQGIKLVLEDQPADNFGRQLKSFTDWLKVMKRLPARPVFEKTDEKEAERIRHFAAHSIEERDILTESMAEVLAKQGMYENAIALYQKLSLIYPPKSAYFASRIEQLKASIP
ncbi:MAG TPA: hypothetical protein VII44_07650 [Puia sp.]